MFYTIRTLNSIARQILICGGLAASRQGFAPELVPIVGNIAKAIHGVVMVPEGMEHGQRAVGRLSCAGCVFRP
jgi:hypothetical protein